MAPRALTDCDVYTNSADLTAQVNGVDVEGMLNDIDDGTNMASDGWKEMAGGILSGKVDLNTFLDATTCDSVINGVLGSNSSVLSVCSDDAAGSIAYFGLGHWTALKRMFVVGKIARVDGSWGGEGASSLIRGQLILPKTTAAATANSTGQQLGAVSATQLVYASLHVFAASGSSPTLDCIVQSDDNSGFSSATTRITFAQKTTTGFAFGSAAGAITDDYWRLRYTIGGSGPSFTFAACIGIQ